MRLRFVAVTLVFLLTGLGLGLYMFTPDGVPFRAEARDFTPYEPAPFSQALRSGKTIVVHVHAPWCPACKQQTPTLQAMAREPGFSSIDFVRVDFDTQKDFLKENNVPVQSVILVFRNGQTAARIVGIVEPNQLRAKVAAAVS